MSRRDDAGGQTAPIRRDFDLSERITDRLRDLVAKYPKGLGIVKEFLQNADDSGASELRIIYDQRQHSGSFDDPAMNVALGPALLLMNDRPFTSDDLRHIQTISDSGKRTDAARTGRFGQGFSTTYSVSDVPSLLTGDTLVWFDPHHRILDRNRNAFAWELRSAARAWPAWIATFTPAGAATDGTPYPGTIFRLPVRTPETAQQSEIRKEPFTKEDWETILTEARATGPALLVFLRGILKLELYEIPESGPMRLRIAIRSKDEKLVRRARRPLHSAVTGRPIDLLRRWVATDTALPAVEFTHDFEVSHDGARAEAETWEVVSQICRGPNDALLRAATALCESDEKVLPWAGAAARREGNWSSVPGGYACFLPLPEAGEAPVWQHGWFALDSSARRNLARVPAEDQSKRHVEWNSLLMEHGVGPAWARLIVRMRGDAPSTRAPYDRWPMEAKSNNAVDAACSAGFYNAVKALAVFRARHLETIDWHEGNRKLISLPERWHTSLEDPLAASKLPVLTPPLPTHVRAGLEQSPGGPRLLSPAQLRDHVKAVGVIDCPVTLAPRPWLCNAEWAIQIAAYCSSDGIDHLATLPLALTASGTLRNFNRNDTIYLARPGDRILLAPFPHRVLDARFQKVVLSNEEAASIGARTFDVAALVRVAEELCTSGTSPTAPWLRSFFERLEQAPDLRPHATSIKALAIVPGRRGTMHKPGTSETPLLPTEDHTQNAALARLGVEFIAAPRIVMAAIERFARRHRGFVSAANAEVVAQILVARFADLDWDACNEPATLNTVLDLLAAAPWDKLDLVTRDGLRTLEILPTSHNRLVSADTQDTYVLETYRPPDLVAGHRHFIDATAHPRRREFFARLGVPTLDGLRFAMDVVLPSFAEADVATQDALLLWLRDDVPRMFLNDRGHEQLSQRIRTTAILPVAGSVALEAPARLYSPDASVDEVLGQIARKPDPSRFTQEPARWRQFFDRLHLARSPRAGDLHAAILSLANESVTGGVESILPTLFRQIAYLDEHWTALRGVEVSPDTTLEAALATTAWLPAKQLTAEDCASALRPESRLFYPDELATNSARDLVASQRPILDGNLGSAAATALGVIARPAPAEVIAHFEVVQNTPIPSSPKALSATRAAFKSILRHLGANDEAATACRERSNDNAASFKVLIGTTWRDPARVFLSPLTTAFRGACSVHDDSELAASTLEGTASRRGLELLGVQQSPTHDDWLTLLCELAQEHENGIMTSETMKLANGALLELRSADDEWLRLRPVHVPTDDQRLILARDAFLPGDPRLRHPMVTPIAIVANIREIVELAQRAGAAPLHDALTEILHPTIRISRDADSQTWTLHHEALLRSDGFLMAIHRLAFQQGLQDRLTDPNGKDVRERVKRASRLRLHIADCVRIESRLRRSPAVLIFDLEAPSFLEDSRDTLWLSKASERRMRDELVRAISRQCGIGDTLSLSRLLECEPETMHIVLDEDGIAALPIERELTDADIASHEPTTVTTIPVTHAGSDRHNAVGEDGNWVDGTDDNPSETTPAPFSEWRGEAVDPNSPRPTTSGSSRPWSIDRRAEDRGDRFGGQRLYGYLYSNPQTDYDTFALDRMPTRPPHEPAVAEVLQRATARGATVTQADAALDGYDLVIVHGSVTRYVRVLGIWAGWTARGVPLTKRDIETAQREGDRWWVHIVEHISDPERTQIHEVQNPLHHAQEFRLDDRWRTAGQTIADPELGDIVVLDDARRATVVKIETFGREKDVELQFESGETEVRVWQPRWKQEV